MAYRGYEFTNTAGTRAAVFSAIKAFLVAVGWTLHDAVSATVEVYKSNGESGEEPYGYIWIDAGTSTYIQFQAFQWWNATTHAGLRGVYPGATATVGRLTTAYLTATAAIWAMAGDKDFVAIKYGPAISVSSSCIAFGHIPGRFDKTLTTAMGTAGTTGTLLVSSSSKLGAGKRIQICGGSGEGVDSLVVSSVIDANNIIVGALPRSYGTGSIIGTPASVFGITGGGSTYWNVFTPTGFYGDAGTSVSAGAYGYQALSSPNLTSALLHFTQKYYSAPIFVVSVSATSPGIYLGVFHENMISFNGSLLGGDCLLANNDESISTTGVVTAATNTTLSDTSKAWGVDSQAGRFVVITAKTGVGQVRKIVSNTATELTIGLGWITDPVATTEYKIADYIYRLHEHFFGQGSTETGVLITHTEVPA